VSQQEFDNYLALLARLLRIAPQQREQVAEEFRTHMEDRLDDLLSRGMSRDKAVKLALEEFGDAAGLAANLAQISQIRKRRWYMKVSAFSVAGLAAAVLLAIALWPESQRLPATPQAIAQQPAMKGAKGKTRAAPQPTLQEKLAARIEVDFLETPLRDVCDFLSEKNKIQIYINRRALTEESLDLDAPITMSLSDVKVETVLELALDQVSDQLAYLDRDGVLIISTVNALEGATEVQVYNCRDLLALTTPQQGMMMPGMGMGMGGGMGMESMPGMPGRGAAMKAPGESQGDPPGPGEAGFGAGLPESPGEAAPPGTGPAPSSGTDLPAPGSPDAERGGPATPDPFGAGSPPLPSPGARSSIESWNDRAILAQIGGGMGDMVGGPGMMPGAGMGGGRSRPQPKTDHERRAARLMDLITTAVDPGTWQDTGGFGTISEYEGLIVVNHNARTHKKIENVLSMLRQSAGMPENAVMPGMGHGMMGGMGGAMMGAGGGFPGGMFGGGASGGGGYPAGPAPSGAGGGAPPRSH
jgi:hypothetical protein